MNSAEINDDNSLSIQNLMTEDDVVGVSLHSKNPGQLTVP